MVLMKFTLFGLTISSFIQHIVAKHVILILVFTLILIFMEFLF